MEGLNAAQREAVARMEGPVLVLAGAGSGKTRVITHRIARLLERGVAPYRILAVTFTNKAAAEMRERVAKLRGGEVRGLWVATFHSACARILRQSAERVGLTADFTIYDADDQKRLMREICKAMHLSREQAGPRDLLNAIENLKNHHQGPDTLDPFDSFDQILGEVWKRYHGRLRRANAVDFADLLTLALRVVEEDAAARAGWATRWQHVLVDEFQDTNRVQYLLAHRLSQHSDNLCVVGDDDQSIYSWRGADVRNILDFEGDHPNAKVIKLEQNYRSTANILQAAHGVISNNRFRKKKKLWTESGDGERISYFVGDDEREEAQYVAQVAQTLQKKDRLGDMAVFYRVHAQSRALEEALRAAAVPYRMVAATRFYDRAEIKDLIAYLRVVFNPASDLDLKRIINSPRRGIGATTVRRCVALAQKEQKTLYEALKIAATPQAGVLGSGARKKVARFIVLMEDLRALAGDALPSAIAEAVLDRSGYTEALSTRGDPESMGRIENLLELVGSIRAYEADCEEKYEALYALEPEPDNDVPQTDASDSELKSGAPKTNAPTLGDFLERVALTADADGEDGRGRAATLMTVHAAKGLEFPVVVVTGLEEGVFPHARGMYEEDGLEEERRLAYVAFTRAKEKLYLTRTVQRSLMGQIHHNPPARFIHELPATLLQEEGDTRSPQSWREFALDPEWGRANRAATELVFGAGKTQADRGPRNRRSGGRRSGGRASSAGKAQLEQALAEKARAQKQQARSQAKTRSRKRGLGGGQKNAPSRARQSGDSTWYAGMKVRHKKFGLGTVQAWYGKPPEQKISVYFFNHGVKTIVASYLEVENR